MGMTCFDCRICKAKLAPCEPLKDFARQADNNDADRERSR